MYGKTSGTRIALKKIKKLKNNSNMAPELLDTIERYDNGTMTQEERLHFEERIDKDSVFKTAVEDLRIMLLAIETQALKEQMDAFHKEIPNTQSGRESSTKVRFLSFISIAIAAGIIIALSVFWFLGGSSNDRLYSKYFKPDPGLPTTMSASDNFAFYDGMVNYKQNDYKTAISKWETISANAPTNDTINYFLGVAHMANKNVEKAVPYLNKTVDNEQSVFNEDAYYYLGLAYLKSNNIKAATQAFQKSQSAKSQEILKALNTMP